MANKRVLRFDDGSARFGDPTLYLTRDAQAPLVGSDLDRAIVDAVQVSVAAAMTTAAAKSAAAGKARR